MITSLQKSQKIKTKSSQTYSAATKTLVRELDINVTGKQARWIKCRTWSYKKMIKNKEELMTYNDRLKQEQKQPSANAY